MKPSIGSDRRPSTRVTWTHPGIDRILDAIPIDADSLLDAGSGRGIIGALCRIYRDFERQVGIDASAAVLETCGRHDFYDELLQRDLTELPLPFATGEFDVVTCVEVIEHLSEPEALGLLAELERVGKTVIVTTPNGFMEQDDLEGNPWQHHQSGWRPRDFTRRGYRVRGVGGMKILGGHRRLISSGLGPMTYFLPRFSELLLCVRAADR